MSRKITRLAPLALARRAPEDLVELVDRADQIHQLDLDMQEIDFQIKMLNIATVTTIIVLLIMAVMLGVIVLANTEISAFEDGSFALSGCLPWASCALP